jgi:hypothetical protein
MARSLQHSPTALIASLSSASTGDDHLADVATPCRYPTSGFSGPCRSLKIRPDHSMGAGRVRQEIAHVVLSPIGGDEDRKPAHNLHRRPDISIRRRMGDDIRVVKALSAAGDAGQGRHDDDGLSRRVAASFSILSRGTQINRCETKACVLPRRFGLDRPQYTKSDGIQQKYPARQSII